MNDFPRFYEFKGEQDAAHQRYYGGRLVSFIFRLVDAWKARSNRDSVAVTPDRPAAVEVHERSAPTVPAEFFPGTTESMAPMQSLYRQTPDETYSRDFLVGSAKTMKGQRGLLAAFVAVLFILLAQGWNMLEKPRGQVARKSAPPAAAAVATHRAPAPTAEYAR